MRTSLATSICFAIASYAVTVTGTALSCAVWLHIFTVPPGTPSYRPMGASLLTVVVAGLSTLLAGTLAVACIVTNWRKVIVWVVGIPLLVVSLAPMPIAQRFVEWALKTQGVEMAS